MNKVRSRLALPMFIVALVIGLVRPFPVRAKANTVTWNTTVTLGSVRFYECAGELIEIHGDYHMLFHVTFDGTGGTHVMGQSNSQGITGLGLESGATFVAADGDRRTTNIFGAPGFEFTFVDTFQLIGEGQAPNLLMHVTRHVTLTPNREFTAQVINISVECR